MTRTTWLYSTKTTRTRSEPRAQRGGAVQPAEVRQDLIRRLTAVIHRLPNGLLHRLLADALFFEAWNAGKRKKRGQSRMAQHKAMVEALEERYWKNIRR